MNEAFIFGLFLVDAGMVAVNAWLALRAVGGGTSGRLEPFLSWGLMFIAVVAGSGAILGLTGTLGRGGFFVLHAGLLALLLAGRRRHRRADATAARDWLAGLRQLPAGPDWSSRGAAGLGLLALLLAMLGAAADPLVLDVLTYRLPRIALWLEEGRIVHFAAADPRLDYMPWVPDLFGAWLLGAATGGWPLVAVAQTFGGTLLLGATIGLAREAGLGRGAAIGAATLMLGLANVAVQFTTPQTDLFAAGTLAAAFCLWQGAHRRGEGSFSAGLGAALALGAKGTVFYIAPGLLVVVAYLLARHRSGWRAWALTLGGAFAGVVLWVLPAGAMNLATHGGVFGPADAVRLHHGERPPGLGGRMEKLWLNLRSSAVQLFDPHAQPAGLRGPARQAGVALLRHLPEPAGDPFAFAQLSRRFTLAGVMDYPRPDADVLGCGLLAVIAFLAAGGTLLISGRGPAVRPLVLAGAGAVVVYVLFQHAVVQWHGWAFRFMVLAAPWWAVTVAAGVEAWAPRWRAFGWSVLLAAGGSVFWHVTTQTPQAGWRAFAHPEGAPTHFVQQSWARWARTLRPEGSSLWLASDHNRPIAAFLRQLPPRSVHLMSLPTAATDTAEELLAGKPGWLVVSLARFIGREGRVQVRTWINPGAEGDSYSLAAYRRLAPGESPAAVLYRNRRTDTAENVRRSLLVRNWSQDPVSLQIFNPRTETCHWLVIAPDREYQGEVAAGATAELALALPADSLTELLVVFGCAPAGPAPAVALSARSAPDPG